MPSTTHINPIGSFSSDRNLKSHKSVGAALLPEYGMPEYGMPEYWMPEYGTWRLLGTQKSKCTD